MIIKTIYKGWWNRIMKKMHKKLREDNNIRNNCHPGKEKDILVGKCQKSNNLEGKRKVRSEVVDELMQANY